MSKAICVDRHNQNPDVASLIRATLANTISSLRDLSGWRLTDLVSPPQLASRYSCHDD